MVHLARPSSSGTQVRLLSHQRKNQQIKAPLTHWNRQPPATHKEHHPLLEHPPTTAHDISHDLSDPGGRGKDEPGTVPRKGYPDREVNADKRGREEPDALVFCTDPGY